MSEWHDILVDTYGKEVSWDFRQHAETRNRWSRELTTSVHRYNEEFMEDVIKWAVKKFERKNPKNDITLPELKDMCFAYLNRNKDAGPIQKDDKTRLQSICLRVKNAVRVEKDIFKAWDLMCEAGSNYNCAIIHRWAEEKLGADFSPVRDAFAERRLSVEAMMAKGFKDVAQENARDQHAWLDGLDDDVASRAEPQDFGEDWI